MVFWMVHLQTGWSIAQSICSLHIMKRSVVPYKFPAINFSPIRGKLGVIDLTLFIFEEFPHNKMVRVIKWAKIHKDKMKTSKKASKHIHAQTNKHTQIPCAYAWLSPQIHQPTHCAEPHLFHNSKGHTLKEGCQRS